MVSTSTINGWSQLFNDSVSKLLFSVAIHTIISCVNC